MNRRNLGYAIALSALLISIPRYIATFAEIDPWAVTAYGMGILLAGGAAYMVDAWASARKRRVKRADHLLLVLAINLLYEPLLLTPFVLARLWSLSLREVMSPAYAVFWSVIVTLAPVLLVFGVIYAVWFHQQPSKPANRERKPATASELLSESSKISHAASKGDSLACDVCKREFRLSDYASERAAINALNAHQRKHRRNPGE